MTADRAEIDSVSIVAIRDFKEAVAWFSCEGAIQEKESVIVETEDGLWLAPVLRVLPRYIQHHVVGSFSGILRKAEDVDLLRLEDLVKEAQSASTLCQKKSREHHLPIDVIQSVFTFDRQKIKIKYKAPTRVDFRSLVRDLAKTLHCRIEMYHVGTRDQAKEIGGIGRCGKPICCTAFLYSFPSFLDKRRSSENRSVGLCGKTRCCLHFDYSQDCRNCAESSSCG